MNNSDKPFPVLMVLFLIFMTLKLTGHIDWSWWWITAPLWAVPAVILVLLVVFLPFYIIKRWRE